VLTEWAEFRNRRPGPLGGSRGGGDRRRNCLERPRPVTAWPGLGRVTDRPWAPGARRHPPPPGPLPGRGGPGRPAARCPARQPAPVCSSVAIGRYRTSADEV
jgi:hypothetical protein